ncbi:MAG: cadherin domain-containing protein, partial [Gammaproteobacteria bacterium]
MADDKGKIYDSINEVNEEGSLEKTNAQESLSGPDGREEHFKQNIMMDVDARPDGIEVIELSESQQVIEETDESLTQTVQQDVSQTSVNLDSDRPEYESKDSDQQTLGSQGLPLQADAAQNQDIDQAQSKLGATGEDGSQSVEKFSAFELQSVDQQIEEALIGESAPSKNAIGDVSDADSNANQVNESASIGDFIGVTAFADDLDANDSVVYSLSENPNNAFAIDPVTGVVTIADPSGLDFETAATMQIEVTATSTDGSSNALSFDIVVSDDNTEFSVSAVTDSDASVNTINESASVGDSVGVTGLATDGDASDSVTYTLTSNPNNAFAIDETTGEVTVADPSGLDFETASTMQIEVTATSTDGSSNASSFDISVSDDNSEFSISAVTDSDVSVNSINESASIGDSVGVTGLATDADASDSITYSLTTNPNNAFAIDASTGEVTV